MKHNILFVHHTTDFGGGSDKSLYELVSNMGAEKFNRFVILRRGDPMVKLYRAKGISTTELNLVSPPRKLISRQGGRFLVNVFTSTLKIATFIIKNKIKVVHSNTSLNIQAALASKIANRKLVWHVRENLQDSLKDRLVLGTVKVLADKIIVISKSVERRVCSKKSVLIYNGTVFDDSLVPSYSSTNSDIKVHCVGRLEEWKGQHVVLEAIHMSGDLTSNCQFIFVGAPAENKPEYAELLKDYVKRKKLKNVSFIGYQEDVIRRLHSGDVLLVPTVTSEPFGRTVIEGMAAGNVVVASDAGGPSEIINDQEDGILITPGSAESLSQTLIDISRDINRYEELRKRAIKKAREQYCIVHVVRKMEKQIVELLN